MRYAILSDIHGNLEAFRRVIEYLNMESIDRYLFLGDIVGYGANPNECIEIIKNNYKYYSVIGNHDAVMVNRHFFSYYNPYAKKCLEWTWEVLSHENKQFLETLPLTTVVDDIQLVHSSPSTPDSWYYMTEIEDIRENLNFIGNSICFFGHTHRPAFYTYDSTTDVLTLHHPFDTIDVAPDQFQYIINVGSVGQPRDGNPKTSFGIYDTNYQQIKLIRLEYDNRTASKKISDAGLPDIIAQRLLIGQ